MDRKIGNVKHFTIEEANRLIPDLERILRQIQALNQEINEKALRLKEEKQAARRRGETIEPGTFLQPEAELDFLITVLGMHEERIAELGAQLKDEVKGLVDFPCRRGGQELLLCWQLGEPEVQFFHGLYDGVRGRKPIDLLPADAEPGAAN